MKIKAASFDGTIVKELVRPDQLTKSTYELERESLSFSDDFYLHEEVLQEYADCSDVLDEEDRLLAKSRAVY